MEKKRTFRGILLLTVMMFALAFPSFADAAPNITILKGNPSSKVSPPYTITFRVTDTAGIVSITVNGRELGPGGGDEYEADWTTYYNGSYTITATNTNGGSSSSTVEITNIATALEQTQIPSTQAPPTQAPQTQAPPTQAPQTQAPPTQPQTEPPAAQTAAHQTEAPTTTQGREEEPITETQSETQAEEGPSEPDSTESLEGMTEPESMSHQPVQPDIRETEEPSTEPETTPAYPPDSYKLYPGGKENKLIPILLIWACICFILYFMITLALNKKRKKAYQALYDVLIKRQELKYRGDDSLVDGLPEEEESEQTEGSSEE